MFQTANCNFVYVFGYYKAHCTVDKKIHKIENSFLVFYLMGIPTYFNKRCTAYSNQCFILFTNSFYVLSVFLEKIRFETYKVQSTSHVMDY
jgi:hypothetical protein